MIGEIKGLRSKLDDVWPRLRKASSGFTLVQATMQTASL